MSFWQKMGQAIVQVLEAIGRSQAGANGVVVHPDRQEADVNKYTS